MKLSTKSAPCTRATCILLPAAKEFRHDEHVAFVLLDLGRVVGVEDILHHQKVDTEPVADLPHGFGLFQPVHLKPDHPLFGELRFDRREAVGRVFVHLVRRITHQMEVVGVRVSPV